MQYEIEGAGGLNTRELAAAISGAVDCKIETVDEYAAHLAAPDGTLLGIMPEINAQAPAIMYLLGPSARDIADTLKRQLADSRGWDVHPAAGSDSADAAA